MDSEGNEPLTREKALENFGLIKEIIRESRTLLIENGSSFVFFGAMISLVTLVSYVLAAFGYNALIWWLWGFAYIFGLVLWFLLNRAKFKKNTRTSFAGRIYGVTWGGSGIAITVLGLSGLLLGRIDLPVFLAQVSAIIGISYFVSGAITRFIWMMLLSGGWWAGSIVLFLLPWNLCSAFMGSMVFAFELVPGLILYSRNRKKRLAE
jgi:hypothetical protein